MNPYRRMRRRRRIALIITFAVLVFGVYHFFFADRPESPVQPGVSDNLIETAPVLDPIPVVSIEPKYKVVIDPGHGGKDGGAIGVSGQLEKDFTLQLSHLIKDLLDQEADIQTYMTRSDDTFISSIDRERAEFANELGADLLISIHGNTFTDPTVSGTETYYYDEASFLFANTMHKHVVNATGFRDRGTRQEDYFIVKETNMPAVLIEVGYLTNPQEEEEMWDDELQSKIASSIVSGIKKYLEFPIQAQHSQ